LTDDFFYFTDKVHRVKNREWADENIGKRGSTSTHSLINSFTKNQWHDEQSEEPQLAQPDPEPADEDLNLKPTENPKEDIFFVGVSLPQDGQAGSSLLKTSISNSFPHFSHIYS
jgi:hypothetical protein